MDGITGDLQAKYQKLASEYAKVINYFMLRGASQNCL